MCCTPLLEQAEESVEYVLRCRFGNETLGEYTALRCAAAALEIVRKVHRICKEKKAEVFSESVN